MILWYLKNCNHQVTLSWANSIQSPRPPQTSWRSILILSFHLCLGLPNGLFPSGFPTNSPTALHHHTNKHYDTQTFGWSWWPSILSALTWLCGPHLNVCVSRVSGVSRFAAKTRDVTGYDAGLSHVDEEVHCEVLSTPVFLWRPDRTGVFLSTFRRLVITSVLLSKTNLKRALLTYQSLIFMDPCIVVRLSRNTNKMWLLFQSLLKVQHVSSGTPLIIRSSKLYLQPLVYILQ